MGSEGRDELYFPITQVETIGDGGRKRFLLDEESNEDVLIGLDYLQKGAPTKTF